jgi:glycosyltransferase involved in cell wall biosynthesis
MKPLAEKEPHVHGVHSSPRLDHVVVCICTYRRQAGVARLLHEIEKQETAGAFTLSVVVVDNDSAQSAKGTVESFAAASTLQVDYHCQPEQNISLARNTAIRNATGEYVALIDDDEWPESDWLLQMHQAIRQYQADGALGPVKPCFESPPPGWVVRGRFFEKPRRGQHKTGSILRWTETRTSNVLLKTDVFVSATDLFDPRFGRGGGEDVDFFGRMIAKGRVFVWCQEAPVFELISPDRCTRNDMLRRALLRGKMSLLLPTAGARDSFKSVIALTLYTLALPVLFFVGHHVFMTYLVKCGDHAGKLLTVCGMPVIEERYVRNR